MSTGQKKLMRQSNSFNSKTTFPNGVDKFWKTNDTNSGLPRWREHTSERTVRSRLVSGRGL
jgi:hypothetical protein